MDDTMLGRLVRLIVTVPNEFLGSLVDLLEKLLGKEGRMWFNALKRFLRKENVWEQKTITIDRSKPFDLEEFFRKGWEIVEEDRRSLDLTELDLTSIRFEHMLKQGESRVGGEEKLSRLKKAGYIRLDAKVFQTLWENQELIPESWKEETNGNITFIFFDGTILRRPDGLRCVLCLYWGGGEWSWSAYWLGGGWDTDGPSAVLANY